MPGVDRILDPLLGDYVDDGKGSWQTTTDLRTAIAHQLKGELGRWVGDPDSGSDLYTLARERNSEAKLLKAKDIITRALKPFVDLGLAAQLEVQGKRDAGPSGRFTLSSSIHDVQHGQLDLTPLLPGGP